MTFFCRRFKIKVYLDAEKSIDIFETKYEVSKVCPSFKNESLKHESYMGTLCFQIIPKEHLGQSIQEWTK